MNNLPAASYFLGANTPTGFYSLFDSLYDPGDGWKCYIIKGGPGTGKSTLMKKAAAEADKKGLYCERIFCSSDPKSLDGVRIPGLKTAIADGTPPHVLEPVFPGVSETIIDLGRFRDDEKLKKNAGEIIRKTKLASAEHRKCAGFMAAAKAMDDDMKQTAFAALKTDKTAKFTNRLAQSEFGTVSDRPGKISRKFLNALTPSGETVFFDTFDAACEKRIVLEDEFGVASSMMIRMLSELASARGLDCTVCPCCTDPAHRCEHLIIPSLSLGFFTSNRFHPYGGEAARTVDCKRFHDPERLKAHRSRIAFDRKAKDEMLDEAINKLVNAKKLHDELERYYTDAMDFSASEEFAEEFIGRVFSSHVDDLA